MTVTAVTMARPHQASPSSDRTAFLLLVGAVWIGVLSGFGTESFSHIQAHGLDYPIIVHVHALMFTGWLALFTIQMALVRSGRVQLHRRLGVVGLGLAAVMVVNGIATALVTERIAYAATHAPPVLLAVQLTDMAAFAGLVVAALALRRSPAAHGRLMLIGLIYISNAGFGRFLGHFAAAPLGSSPLARPFTVFALSDVLVLALGAYDLAVRRRLHPAYVAGVAWCAGWEALTVTAMLSPAWRSLSTQLIGG